MRSDICNIVNDSRINLSENRQRLCYRKHSVRARRIEIKTGDSLSDSTNHKCYVSRIVLSDSLTLEHRHTISKCLDLIAQVNALRSRRTDSGQKFFDKRTSLSRCFVLLALVILVNRRLYDV